MLNPFEKAGSHAEKSVQDAEINRLNALELARKAQEKAAKRGKKTQEIDLTAEFEAQAKEGADLEALKRAAEEAAEKNKN